MPSPISNETRCRSWRDVRKCLIVCGIAWIGLGMNHSAGSLHDRGGRSDPLPSTAPASRGSVDAARETRRRIDLSGPWELTAGNATRVVQVPGTFEQQIGIDFDGIGTYRRTLEIPAVPESMRLLLRFEGVATIAVVRLNGHLLGTHTGGWTPFWFDLTEFVRSATGETWNLEVTVDEAVGHHTQGFLPIVAPHFGGIWQPVYLENVPETWIDEQRLFVAGRETEGPIRVSVPVLGSRLAADATLNLLALTADGETSLAKIDLADVPTTTGGDTLPAGLPERRVDWAIPRAAWPSSAPLRAWSPDDPQRYRLAIQLESAGEVLDRLEKPFAFVELRSEGRRLLLNGQPLSVRGMLNWGYAPPGTAPTLDETAMRTEIELARRHGCNLMKFCLWMPPKRYLELCDELGMLAWIEYPTWHAQLVAGNLAELSREYDEFFYYDRQHPAVILRSLTCETGSSAELPVIQALYDQCKARIPGAMVEDDSSWIEWNRIHDFYDDHPYGNCHTWPTTLGRLNRYIDEHGMKPLILGEAIAADTWTSPAAFAAELADSPRPFWLPPQLEANAAWLQRLTAFGRPEEPQLAANARRAALLARKYQIETYRRWVPEGGYVLSVLRDFPLASMGFLDYRGEPKWSLPSATGVDGTSSSDWSFHGATMLLLASPGDRRGFAGGSAPRLDFHVSHFGPADLHDAEFTVELEIPETDWIGGRQRTSFPTIARGTLTPSISWDIELPDVDRPTRGEIRARLATADQALVENAWPIWILPTSAPPEGWTILRHESCRQTAAEFGLNTLVVWSDSTAPSDRLVVIAERFDDRLLDFLEAGGRVLMIPGGERGSFDRTEHWFLRGGPVVFAKGVAFANGRRSADRANVPPAADPTSGLADNLAELFVDLQQFDWGGPVVARIDHWLQRTEPLLALWDNHDSQEIRTHGLLFSMPVGGGEVLVSTLNLHTRPHDEAAAGQPDWAARAWLFHRCLAWLAERDTKSQSQEIGRDTLRTLRGELHRGELDLSDALWKFSIDTGGLGPGGGAWTTDAWDDATWPSVRIDRAWEAQGFDDLDGWALYRRRLEIPAALANAPQLFLNVTGVDDHYRLYVNGQLLGSGGDLDSRTSAFDERKSFEISPLVEPGRPLQIAVAVYDWYGAGGIFRPIFLATQPISDAPPMLK